MFGYIRYFYSHAQPAEPIKDSPGTHRRLTRLRIQPQDNSPMSIGNHTHTHGLLRSYRVMVKSVY